MARVLISGASGFIGKELVPRLASEGHEVWSLKRSANSISSRSLFWDPDRREASSKNFEHFDAVIHLAGEPLTLSRWSRQKKEKILTSRKEGTLFLSEILSSLRSPPRLFLSASAIGYYGDRGNELLNETSGSGQGFLAQVCREWEQGSAPLKGKGVHIIHARFGMVLGEEGGALQKMVPLFRLGLGGKWGSGEQWVSWIHQEDLIRFISEMVRRPSLEGAVNLVSPHPVRQKEFGAILAHLLRKPHFFTTPAWFLRLCFGTAAEELLLASACVECAKLFALKFQFEYPDLRSALRKALQI